MQYVTCLTRDLEWAYTLAQLNTLTTWATA